MNKKIEQLNKKIKRLEKRLAKSKGIEEELKNSEERFKILFEYAPDAYFLSDLKGGFIDGNIAAEKLIGYKKKEIIGKSMLKLKLLSLNQIPKAAKRLALHALGESTEPGEFILSRKDRSQALVEISGTPVKIKGKVVVLGIARDITKRKEAEEALKKKNEDLEKFKKLVLGRELKMVELKKRIKELEKEKEKRAGEPNI